MFAVPTPEGTLNLSAAMGLLVAVLLVVMVYRVFRSRRLLQLVHWKRFADAYKLKMLNPVEPHDAAIKGDYRGVPIEVKLGGGHTARPLQLCTLVYARHVGSVPPGLEIYNRGAVAGLTDALRGTKAGEVSTGNPDLDKLILLRAWDEDKTVETLSHPKVWDGLGQLFSFADYVRVDERGVLLEKNGVLGDELAAWVERAAVFSVNLCEAYEEPLVIFAKKHKLSLAGAGTPGERTVRGHFKGGRVVIVTGFDAAQTATRSTIKAAMPVALPTGFRITRRKGEPDDVGILIADKQLAAVLLVQGTNAVAIQRLLRNPELKQTLLQLFEVCPEPSVEGAWVSATGPGIVCGDVEAQVDAVMGVAQTLAQAWLPLAAVLDKARKTTPSGSPRV